MRTPSRLLAGSRYDHILFNFEKAALALEVDEATLRRLVDEGDIRTVIVDSSERISGTELRRWVLWRLFLDWWQRYVEPLSLDDEEADPLNLE